MLLDSPNDFHSLFRTGKCVDILVCDNLKYATDILAGIEVEKPPQISINVTMSMFMD